jgi:hypothetical protein
MKANEYLKLTERMMTAQADYYATAKKFGRQSPEALIALIKSKDLEKQVRAVIKEGKLEPDEVHAIERLDEEGYKEYLRLINENQIELQLSGKSVIQIAKEIVDDEPKTI